MVANICFVEDQLTILGVKNQSVSVIVALTKTSEEEITELLKTLYIIQGHPTRIYFKTT